MKKTIITAILAAMTLLLIGCSASNERIDLTDPLSGSSILSAADLEAFFKYGENDTAVLAASFSMEDTMLKLTAQRGSITIDGNGYTLSGTGDCIIRLDEGCKLTLNDITVHSGSTAIGCLGSAEIGGENANIIGVSDGILCADELIVSEGSSLVCKGSNGRGIDAEDITIKAGASVSGEGVLGGVNSRSDITLERGASLAAYTDENYNALKCDGQLSMADGSALTVENRGRYHGAEIYEFAIEGAVSINATGGSEATGLFITEQHSNMYAVGSCKPEARVENGKGRITFVDDASKIPAEIPQPDGYIEETAETEEQ